MSAVSPISGYGGSLPTQPPQCTQPAQLGGVDGGQAAKAGGPIAGASVSAGQSAVAISQTSISAGVESFVSTYGPVLADNQILGAMLLLLMLEYMQSDDDDEKKGLLGLMLSLLQQQQASQAGGTFIYSSSQFSLQSTQMVAVSQQLAVDVYAGGGSAGAAAPVSGPAGGGVDVVA